MELIRHSFSVILVALIVVINVIQFHHHDCSGSIRFLAKSEIVEHCQTHHSHNHTHGHDCDDKCPIISYEAIHFTDIISKIECEACVDLLMPNLTDRIQIAASAVSKTITFLDYLIPLKTTILPTLNRYRGSPIFA